MRYVPLIALQTLPAVAATATEDDNRIPVFVSSHCESDTVGQRLSFKVREGLRKSASMSSIGSYQNAIMELSVVCANPTAEERSIITRYSYAISVKNFDGFYDFLVTHGVGCCGPTRVDTCAESLVADVDESIGEVREKIEKGTFKFGAKWQSAESDATK